MLNAEPRGSSGAAKSIASPLVCGALAAVLSDTRSDSSPTTTNQDQRAAARLAPRAGINEARACAASMLQAYARAIAGRRNPALINTDCKVFSMAAPRVGISPIEAASITLVLQRRHGLLAAIKAE